jgi:hypothetical protein
MADSTAISQGDILQHAVALALVGNPDDADELAQETWDIGGDENTSTITVWTNP